MVLDQETQDIIRDEIEESYSVHVGISACRSRNIMFTDIVSSTQRGRRSWRTRGGASCLGNFYALLRRN